MYNAFFGFSENPFSLSPDPAFLYRSEPHEEALANLVYGVQSRKGFMVLTGEVGTGKTTMLECLRDYLEAQRIQFAYLFNSRLTPEQFFEMMRSGVRPGNNPFPETMPWQNAARMTDDDLAALYAYLTAPVQP